ncbi:hypothetical protein [Salinarchaeum laminariae]|uniref:hypothetical protein n=1 Tax=Salinarchaeum laminariae TaxID=869888 RepID=UPI0020BD730F|nr:hypothetical protein [Salinarchaeum laminariae]
MSMQRSRQQVLFQFLPGNTFDYSNQRGIWQVSYLRTKDKSGAIDTQYVLDRVVARAQNWDGGHQGFNSRNSEHYHFGEPEGVLARPFPTTFFCQNCQKAHGYYSPDDVSDENPELLCSRCGGDLKQYQFVSVHSCGELRRLYPQTCPTHGDQYIVLDTRDSQRAQNFHWRCNVDGCGWETRVVNYQNCGCDYDPPEDDGDDKMYTTVHRAGSTYYPHYLTTVNLHSAGIGHLRNNEDGAQKAFARLFGLSNSPSVQAVSLDEQVGEGDLNDDRVVEVFQTEDGISSLDEAREWLRRQGEATSQSVGRRLDELIDLVNTTDEQELTAAGDEVLQYVLSLDDLTTRTLADLERRARDRGFSQKADRIDTYHDVIDELGIDAVRVVEDFPVQTFVYGYTRGGREEGQARINAFSRNASDGDGTPIFVDTSETEAVQFDLNISEVLLWLAVNVPAASDENATRGPVSLPEVHDPNPDTLDRARREIDDLTEPEQWAFLINHLDPVDDYGRFITDMDDDDLECQVTEHVFKLLHTFSHVVLKQASTISGFDRTNLSEFLFPRALSVVIYANNREEFNIGGMNTMVEQQLDNLLGQAETHGNECVYDPVCSQRDGACLSCLHVSEISCSYFNQVLSRDYLYGSRPNTDREINGYWELLNLN